MGAAISTIDLMVESEQGQEGLGYASALIPLGLDGRVRKMSLRQGCRRVHRAGGAPPLNVLRVDGTCYQRFAAGSCRAH